MYVNNLYEKLNPDRKDKAKIDLLVISHLDKDHVNGVSKLMEWFDIKKIVIPYMSKIEKIILALGAPIWVGWPMDKTILIPVSLL